LIGLLFAKIGLKVIKLLLRIISYETSPVAPFKSYLVPIPKSHPLKPIQEDLRPISLTPTLSKLLESLIGRWVVTTIAGKFDARQFGALRGRSTTHALTAITHMWHEALENRNSIRALFVDYSKAFDHVDHSTVLRKMAALDIHPRL
jgi:Reverse transcriptase (RNA-dependent DNA polymerase)